MQGTETPVAVGAIPPLVEALIVRPETGTAPPEPGQTLILTDAPEESPVPGGRGGTGKTQLAASFARRLRDTGDPHLLLWVNAVSREAIVTAYAMAADRLGLVDPDPEVAATRLLAWLETSGRPWLVVLDDVAGAAYLTGLWPTGPTGRIVITSRVEIPSEDPYVRTVRMGPFSRREAVAYVMGRLGGDADRRLGAIDLCEDLGDHPLPLGLATAVMVERRLTCRQYRDLFLARRDRNGHTAAVTAAWSLATENADRLTPVGAAWPALLLAALMDGSGAWLPVLLTPAARAGIVGRGHAAPAAEEAQIRQAVANLARHGLVTPVGDDIVRVPALVRALARDNVPRDQMDGAVVVAANAMSQAWPETDLLDDHGLRDSAAALQASTGRVLWLPEVHPVIFRAIRSMAGAGLAVSAIGKWQALVGRLGDMLGPDHPSMLKARRELAETVQAAGKPAEAIGLYESALADAERIGGVAHADTAMARAGLAAAYAAAGRREDAIDVHRRGAADTERVLGRHHPAALTAQAELAHACRRLGMIKEAVPVYERTLADRERVLGPDHPDTLSSLSDLAYALRLAGRMKDALPLYQRALADRERALGPDHPDTITARGSLASAYHSARRLADAIPLYERTVKGAEQVLGPGHADTVMSRANLAAAYHSTRRLNDAVVTYRRALADAEEELGTEHSLTRAVRKALAGLTG